ncbi:MAG: RNA-binding protein [Methanomicrobiales archaeon]|nr:RNA-binding protein [Methanomicrobiales archaeon]
MSLKTADFQEGLIVKFVGRVISICGRRLLILRCDPAQLPPLNAQVVDRRLKPVGRLIDIFGNIQAPLAAVLCHEQCTTAPQEKLYAK